MVKAKNKSSSKAKSKPEVEFLEMDDCCDFSDCDEFDGPSELGINKLIEADTMHSSLALELTQLIVENASLENRTMEHIINTFILSSKIVRENSVLHSMLEK